MGTIPRPILRHEWMDLFHIGHSHDLSWDLDARQVKFWSGPIWPPYGRFWICQDGPFRSQISVLMNVTWTWSCMYIVYISPLMHVASFWIFGPRWPPGSQLYHSHISVSKNVTWLCQVIVSKALNLVEGSQLLQLDTVSCYFNGHCQAWTLSTQVRTLPLAVWFKYVWT